MPLSLVAALKFFCRVIVSLLHAVTRHYQVPRAEHFHLLNREMKSYYYSGFNTIHHAI